jgi:hypothetical protein
MEMSESFAATVAAVAPVIFLVGIVELFASARMQREGTTRLYELRNAGNDLVALSRAAAAFKALYGFLAGFVWVLSVVSLCIAETMSLQWLATPEPTPDPGTATFCLWSLAGGMVWAAVPAVVRALFEMRLTIGEIADRR